MSIQRQFDAAVRSALQTFREPVQAGCLPPGVALALCLGRPRQDGGYFGVFLPRAKDRRDTPQKQRLPFTGVLDKNFSRGQGVKPVKGALGRARKNGNVEPGILNVLQGYLLQRPERLFLGQQAQRAGELELHPGILVDCQLEQFFPDAGILQASFRQADPMFPERGILRLERLQHQLDVKRTQSFERPQRMKAPGRGSRFIFRQIRQRRHDGPVLAFHQKLLRLQPPPQVWIRQLANQLPAIYDSGGGGSRCPHASVLRRFRSRGRQGVIGDSIDPPPIAARIEIHLVHHLRRYPFRVLHDLAVEIHDIEGAVRTQSREYRAEPAIGGRQKLALLLGAPGCKCGARRGQEIAVDNIVHGVAYKKGASILRGKSAPFIHRSPAGGGEVTDLRFVNVERTFGNGIKRGCVSVIRDRLHRRLRGQVGVPEKIRTIDDDVTRVVVVPDRKAISALRVARHGFQFEPVGLEAQVHSSAENVDGWNLGMVRKTDGLPHVPKFLGITAGRPKFRIRGIDPVIDSVDKPIHSKLRIQGSEPGQNHTFDVSAPVPVCVGQVENVRRGSHQDPVSPGKDTVREVQTLGKDSASLETPVSIPVQQQFYPAPSFPHGIVGHFDYIQPPPLVKSHGDRIDDFRLGGDQLDAKPLRQLKRLERIRGRIGRIRLPASRASQKAPDDKKPQPPQETGHGSSENQFKIGNA